MDRHVMVCVIAYVSFFYWLGWSWGVYLFTSLTPQKQITPKLIFFIDFSTYVMMALHKSVLVNILF